MQSMPIAESSNSAVNSTSISEQNVKPAYEKKILPSEFGLGSNYPNPFNPITLISYQVQ